MATSAATARSGSRRLTSTGWPPRECGFTQYYAGSAVCAPSRCVLMTGRHPGHALSARQSRYCARGRPRETTGQIPIPADTRTLAECSRRAVMPRPASASGGWAGPARPAIRCGTASISSPATSTNGMPTTTIRTFIFEDGQQVAARQSADRRAPEVLPRTDWNDPASYRRFVGTDYVPDRLAERALASFDSMPGSRSFCTIRRPRRTWPCRCPTIRSPNTAANGPTRRIPAARVIAPHAAPRAAYAAMITRMDRDVGRLMQAWTELGLAEQTIFVFTSDNGPRQPGRRRRHRILPVGRQAARAKRVRSTKGACASRASSAGRGKDRRRQIVRLRRSAPRTGAQRLLELVGDKATCPRAWTASASRRRCWARTSRPRTFLYREYPNDGGQQSVRIGDWKAIRQNLLPRDGKTEPDLRVRLYSLADDPGEQRDVSAQRADVVERLERLMREQHTPSAQYPLPALDRLGG